MLLVATYNCLYSYKDLTKVVMLPKSIDVLKQIVDDTGQNQQVRQRAELGLKKLI